MSLLGRLPLPAAAGVVAALGIVGILLGEYFHLGVLSLLTLAVPAVVALVYLREYSRKELVRPAPRSEPSPLPAPEPEVGTEPVAAELPAMPPEPPPIHPDDVTLTLFDDAPPEAAPDGENSHEGGIDGEDEGRTNNSG